VECRRRHHRLRGDQWANLADLRRGWSPSLASDHAELSARSESSVSAFLPDGRHFLYYVRAAEPEVRGIYWASIDNPREGRRVVESMYTGIYAPSSGAQAGMLLRMTEEGGLLAQPFDAQSGQRPASLRSSRTWVCCGWDTTVRRQCQLRAMERWSTPRAMRVSNSRGTTAGQAFWNDWRAGCLRRGQHPNLTGRNARRHIARFGQVQSVDDRRHDG